MRRKKSRVRRPRLQSDKASAWLRRPLAELNGETPLDVAQTEAGARVIATILAKIAWGAAA